MKLEKWIREMIITELKTIARFSTFRNIKNQDILWCARCRPERSTEEVHPLLGGVAVHAFLGNG
jgi:hypothetical protein